METLVIFIFVPALYAGLWQLYQWHIVAFPNSRLYISYWATKIQNQGWQHTNYNVEMRCVWLSGREVPSTYIQLSVIGSSVKLWKMKSLFVCTEHLLFYDKLFTVTWESTHRKFLKCFPDQRCHSVCIWFWWERQDDHKVSILALCIMKAVGICRTQLAHLKLTHVPQMYEIYLNKGSIVYLQNVKYCELY